MKELDFTNEAANMLRFTYMFKDDERCYIPRVYNDYCTQKVLIMEFVDGIRPDDVYRLKKENFDTQMIAENGVHIVLTMILKYGFFHADPHPGNIFIRDNNQFVLIDYGMCASLKPKQITALINFMMGFAKKDSHKITKALLDLTETSYMKESEDLEFEIDELIKKYSYMSYDQVDISGLMNEAFRAIVRYGVRIPSSLFMLVKTLVTIQNVAEKLNAKISIPSMIEPYAKEKIMERFSWDNIKSKIMGSAEDYLYFVEKLPRDIREIVNNFKHDGLKFTIGLGDKQESDRKIRQHINRLAFVFLTGLMMICSTLLMIYDGELLAVRIFFYTSLVITTLTTLRLFAKSSFS
jgi:ubiquinone biosynthesis protein